MYSDNNDWRYAGNPDEQQPYYFYPQQGGMPDPNAGYGQPNYGQYVPPNTAPQQQQQPQQAYFNPMSSIPGMDGMNPVLTNFAKQYGENLVGQGRDMMDQKLQKFVTLSKLKYYFAVDTVYVMKKMGLLFFPFTHKDWTIRFDKNEDDAVQPRYEINAPDLYIPLMGFITYILIAGVSLGLQQKFSPEVLGIQASSALGWLLLELMIFTGSTYVIPTDLKVFDLLAFCAYKFVGMIFILVVTAFAGKTGFYSSLLYTSLALVVFLIRTLKVQIYSVTSHEHVIPGNKRRLYLLLSLACVQPFMMWWLTYHLTKW